MDIGVGEYFMHSGLTAKTVYQAVMVQLQLSQFHVLTQGDAHKECLWWLHTYLKMSSHSDRACRYSPFYRSILLERTR